MAEFSGISGVMADSPLSPACNQTIETGRQEGKGWNAREA